jgi:uncharacterized membrane protein
MRQELLLAVFGMVAVGVADVLRRRGLMLGGSPATYMAIESGFIAVFSFIAVLLLERKLDLTRGVVTYSPVTGFLIFAGILALLIALSTGEANRYVPITRLGFVVTVLLSTLVFGESMTLSKGLGAALAVGAVILLSLDF